MQDDYCNPGPPPNCTGTIGYMWILRDTGHALISADNISIASNTTMSDVFSLNASSGESVSGSFGPGILLDTGITSLFTTNSSDASAVQLNGYSLQLQPGGAYPATITQAANSVLTISAGGGGSGIALSPGTAGISVSGNTFTPASTTVGALPAASSYPGAIMYVTDSASFTNEGQPCAGSGTTKALAFSNGSTWKCF